MSHAAPYGFAEGLRWIGAGFGLIWRRPMLWLLLTMLLFAVALLAAMLPSVGNLLLYVLSPGILAGLLLVCHQLASDAPPALDVVSDTLRRSAADLLTLGVAYMAIQLGLLFLLATASPEVMQALSPDKAALPVAPAPSSDALPVLLLVLTLSVPATMLMWFSPALVVFRGMGTWPAMRYSLAACLYHWRACLANGIAVFVLLLLASLPAMLGLVIWVPVMIGTLYAAYVAVFGRPGGPQAAEADATEYAARDDATPDSKAGETPAESRDNVS